MQLLPNAPKALPTIKKALGICALCLAVPAFLGVPAVAGDLDSPQGGSEQQKAAKQVRARASTRAIFQRVAASIDAASLSDEELVLACAKAFLGTPYPKYAAPAQKKERTRKRAPKPGEGRWIEDFPFYLGLSPLDCMTLVESVASLARTLRTAPAGTAPSFERYAEDVRAMRFIDGKVTDFASRLHYASDWCFENEKAGRIKNVSREIGGVPLKVRMVAMSEELDANPCSVLYPEVTRRMRERELAIEAREHWFVPNEQIKDVIGKLRIGDIVCFASNRGREDVEHMSIFAGMQGEADTPTIIHASKKAGKTIIEPKGLERYANERKDVKGLVVFRLVLPKGAQRQ